MMQYVVLVNYNYMVQELLQMHIRERTRLQSNKDSAAV